MYTRPEIAGPARPDDRGDPIPYGNRWSTEGAPEEFYTLCEHPQRFRPLLDVGRALIAHLVSTYEVVAQAAEDPAVLHTGRPGVRRHVLIPLNPAAAPLTLVLRDPDAAPDLAVGGDGPGAGLGADAEPTGVLGPEDQAAPLPGVVVCAGALFRRGYPDCGCDGCDDAVEDLAEDLEQHVFAVVAGRLRESLTGRGFAEHTWVLGYGTAVYESATRRVDPAAREVVQAKQVLALNEGRWAPWTPRTA